jgi:transcriptional regulator with XRE-family HTH domain
MQLDPNAMAVARRVREVLADTGVSANKVAADLGWTQSYIARRMSGAVPFSAADLIQISRELCIAPTLLMPTGPTLTTSAAPRG